MRGTAAPLHAPLSPYTTQRWSPLGGSRVEVGGIGGVDGASCVHAIELGVHAPHFLHRPVKNRARGERPDRRHIVYFILLGRTSSSAGRFITFGAFAGWFITFGTFVALEGVSSSITGNRGLSDALVGSGAVTRVELGPTTLAATTPPTSAATAVIKPAMAVSTPGKVVQNPTAAFSSPMIRPSMTNVRRPVTPLFDERTTEN